MDKETYVSHIEKLGNLVRPSKSGKVSEWQEFVKKHKQEEPDCKICKGRKRTVNQYARKKEREEAMEIMGLKKGKNSTGGIIWE